MDTLKNQKDQPEAPNALQRMQEELRLIDERFSNPELQAQLDEFLRKKGYVKAKAGRSRSLGSSEKGQGFVKPMNITPKFIAPNDNTIVRYFLMEMLWRNGFEVVLHEFTYMRSICDVLAIAGGHAIEYELKCSREDYFADFKKTIFTGRPVSKHGALANGSTMINKFYFVVPENMVDIRECPPHAGMIWYSMDGDYPTFKVVKYPALLHKNYLTPGTWQTITKRLMIRCKGLTDRYVNTRYKEIRRGSIYNPTPPPIPNADSNPANSPTDAR